MKRFLSLVFILIVCIVSVEAQTVSYVENTGMAQTLFDNPTNYNDTTAYYRIPAITKMNDGTLLALADVRIGGGKDIGGGNHISIVGKMSTDNGATWGSQFTAVEGLGSGFDYAHGDAAVVTDSDTGKLLLLCASGTKGYGSGGCSLGQYTSTDGTTWTGGEITDTITNAFTSAGLKVSRQFFTSGRIIQSSQIKIGSCYRIYCALCTGKGSIVVYSDDFGTNWTVLGDQVAYTYGDETCLEELPNGDLLLSARLSGSSRGFNVFKYTDKSVAAGSWNSSTAKGIESATNANGEMLLLETSKPNCYVLLHSVALSGRTNVTVYYKLINTDTDDYTSSSFYSTGWEVLNKMSSTTSCYSTMVKDNNGNVAYLFEETSDTGYDIMYRNFTVDVTFPDSGDKEFHPTGFNAESTNMTVTNAENATGDTNGCIDSNNFATLEGLASNGTGYVFLDFDCSSIPEDATITSVECKVKGSVNDTDYFNSATAQLYIGTSTAVGGTGDIRGTSATTVTLDLGDREWTRDDLINAKVCINVEANPSGNVFVYGADLIVTYTIPVPSACDRVINEGDFIVEIYSADGTRLDNLQHGLNIVKKADGSIRKIIKTARP